MHLLLRISAFLILLLLFSKPASGQHWQWATKITGPLADHGYDIAVDAAGNSYVTGQFDRQSTFFANSPADNITVRNSGLDSPYKDNHDIFIAKYDPNGMVIWAQQAGGIGYCIGRGIAVDAAGNSYVTGTFTNQAFFGPFTLTSPAFSDREIFIAKYDPQGRVLWAKQIGGIESNGQIGLDDAFDIAVDAQGNSYLTGTVSGNTKIDHISLTGTGGQVLVAKFDPNGRVVWANNSRSEVSSNNEGNAIALDASGNCYVTGKFQTNTSFGSITLGNDSFTHDIFLAKYDANGKIAWATKASSQGNDYAEAIGVDAAGNSYVAGTCPGNATFDTLSLKLINGKFTHSFLAKYDPNGKAVWVQLTESINGVPLAVAVDPAGQPYFAGTQYDEGADDLITAASRKNLFIAKYDPDGQIKWTKKALGSFATHGLGLAVDKHNACYVTASFFTLMPWFRTVFDAFRLESVVYDTFIAKLNPTGEADPILTLTPLSTRASCKGSELAVSFNIKNPLPAGTTFTVQLSDPGGSFDAPTPIGTGSGSPISAVIPTNIAAGTAYRIRVLASSQAFSMVANDPDGPISIQPLPSPPAVISATRCGPGPVTLQASGASGNQSYRWYTTASGNGHIPDASQAIWITPALVGTATYYVALVNENGCEGPRVAVTATVEPVPGPGEEICENTASFKLSGFSPAGGSWSGPAITVGGIFNPAAAGPGVHVLTYTITSGVCTVSGTKTIAVTPLQHLAPAAPIVLCPDGSPVSVAGNLPPGGRWQGPGVSPAGIFTPSRGLAGTHTLTYSWQTGACINTATQTITVSPPPVVAAAAAPTDCSTANLVLGMAPYTPRFTNTTAGATGFLWDFGDGNTSTESVPTHTYALPGLFQVTLTSFYGNGCSLKVPVTTFDVKKQRPVPNIITPNEDGLNDTFSLSLTCLPVDLKIFNRYGKLIFEKVNYQNTWKGDNLSNGTYYYLITTSNGLAWKGWVEINR